MNSVAKYLIHLLCLLIIQIAILDNIQLHSYLYINIYILAVLILPYGMNKVSVLLIAFLLGIVIDLANNTMGIHAAATTFLAYLRPRLILLTSNREQIDEIQTTHKISNFGWFFKYASLSTLAFNGVLILGEAFGFSNFMITLLRICCSTLASFFFILLYYFIALKTKKE